jgi:glutamate synthase (NADPH) small chain
VTLGYSKEEALLEAERCLMCADQPCVAGCPVGIDIPGFIQKIAEKNFHGAYDTITTTNLLPSVCGRVCPQESQCEGVCTVGESLEPVAIGRLERWVGDMAIADGWANVPYIESSGFRVGIVGSGPAGMACAADMAKAGCDVVVYEAFHTPGGVLKYGIPDFRLPNEVIDVEIDKLKKLGIRFECNTLVGRLFTIEQMVTEMGFHAVFVGTGAGYPSFMGIPGESLNGVLSANELLTRCNLMRARDFPNYDTPLQPGKRVAVIGAGNTAMDAMRVSLRLGAENVYCVYRRTKAEAPARVEEIHHAGEEGVEFHWTRRRTCAPCAASRWNSASPTTPGGVAPCRFRAASSSSRPTWWSTRSAPMPTRSWARPRNSSSTSAATSRPTRTSRPRSPACMPEATSSRARPP